MVEARSVHGSDCLLKFEGLPEIRESLDKNIKPEKLGINFICNHKKNSEKEISK